MYQKLLIHGAPPRGRGMNPATIFDTHDEMDPRPGASTSGSKAPSIVALCSARRNDGRRALAALFHDPEMNGATARHLLENSPLLCIPIPIPISLSPTPGSVWSPIDRWPMEDAAEGFRPCEKFRVHASCVLALLFLEYRKRSGSTSLSATAHRPVAMVPGPMQ